MKKIVKGVFSLVVSLAVQGVWATNYTWTGGGTPNEDGSLNWSDSANWNATAPACPGISSKGAVTTADNVTFPASTMAKIRLDLATTVAMVTVQAPGSALTFVPGGAETTLTVTGDFNLGAANSTGSNGNVLVIDGAKIVAANSTTYLQSGSTLTLKNAAELTLKALHARSTAAYEGQVNVTERSVLTLSNTSSYGFGISGSAVLVIDDATMDVRGCFYLNCNDGGSLTGGGRVIIRGRHPLLMVAGNGFRSENNASRRTGADIDFVVPEGGFDEIPVQYLHATQQFLAGAGNCPVKQRLNLDPGSPALLKGDALDVTLVTAVAGVYAAAAELNADFHQGLVNMKIAEDGLSLAVHIIGPEHVLDIVCEPSFASGPAKIGHDESLSAGDELTLTASPVVTLRGTATPTGARIYDVDPETGAETEIAGSPFVGASIPYVHGTTWRKVVWSWSWSGEGDVFVSSLLGDDANDGLSWSTPKKTIPAALLAVPAGGTVVLGSGEFPIEEPILFAQDARIAGMGMNGSTIVPADPVNQDTRGMQMNHANAVIEDLGISGFARRVGSYDYYGLGLYINTAGGTARRCRFWNNTGMRLRAHGQGVYMTAGSLYGCLIDHNVEKSDGGGGGLYLNGKTAYVESCLVCNNEAGSSQGGGVWLQSGTMVNCTIANNKSQSGSGGGVWVGTDNNNPARMYNCIVWGNAAPGDASPHSPDIKVNNDADAAKYLFNCISATGCGTDGTALDPQFADAANGNFALRPDSPAIDLGSEDTKACLMTVDFAGNPRRVGPIDLGCCEADTTALACGFHTAKTENFPGDPVVFVATVKGASGTPTYAWTISGDGVTKVEDGATCTATFADCGTYDVTLRVTVGGETVSATRAGYVLVAPRTIPVALGESIQAAIDAAIPGATVELADGTHDLDTQLEVFKPITLKGSAYANCTLKIKSGVKTRVLYVNDPGARVEGVTLTGGNQGSPRYSYGCGLWIGAKGGTVEYCRITGNGNGEYYQVGGGVGLTGERAVLRHCVVDGNWTTTSGQGGGVALTAGTVDTCLVYDNTASRAGGLCLANNTMKKRVLNCTFTRNTSSSGVGGGIGLYDKNVKYATVSNCLFAANLAPNDATPGSPEWAGSVSPATADETKVLNDSLFNCAFYFKGEGASVGVDTLLIEQPFVAPDDNDFHLLPGSTAKDAAAPFEGMSDDLDGLARGEHPDIGCYEIDDTKFTCSFEVQPAKAFFDQDVSFVPTVINAPANMKTVWTLTDTFGHEIVLTDAAPVTQITTCGIYDVRLHVEDAENPTKFAELKIPSALSIGPHVCYVAATSGGEPSTPTFPYGTAETAASTLAEAYRFAIDGTLINLTDGTHTLPTQFDVFKAVTIRGSGHENCTVTVAPNVKTRVFYVNNAGARLEGIKITGGAQGEPRYSYGCGLWIGAQGGTAEYCRITGNREGEYYQRGAVGLTGEAAVLRHSIVDNNVITTAGSCGGVALAAGTVDTCLIYGNRSENGGGISLYESGAKTVLNTTVTKNDAGSGIGGGIYQYGDVAANSVTLRNVLFAGNIAEKDASIGAPEWAIVEADAANTKIRYFTLTNGMDHCAFFGALAVGISPVSVQQPFVDPAALDFHLQSGNGAQNAGVFYENISADLDGRARGERPDIGCYEIDENAFACSFDVVPATAFFDQEVALVPKFVNPPENVSCRWTLTDRFGNQEIFDVASPTQTITRCGWYRVELHATDADNPANVADFHLDNALHVAPHEYFAVAGENPNERYPYDTWETAVTDLNRLEAELVDGCTVHLGEGTHQITNELLVSVGATLTGMGRERTTIRYDQPEGVEQGTRALRINHKDAVVEKVTVSGGTLQGVYSQTGSGVKIDGRGGTLRDARVTGSRAATFSTCGGLAVQGADAVVSRTIIDHNEHPTGSTVGGGVYMTAGKIDNCLVCSNKSNGCAGIYVIGQATVAVDIRNCVVIGNECYASSTSTDPGGLYVLGLSSKLKISNCVFMDNVPGGFATAGNCTGYPEVHVVHDARHLKAGEEQLKISLFNNLFKIAGVTKEIGNAPVYADPQFRDAAAWDFSLLSASPCVNAGANLDYTRDSLDLYGARRVFNFGKKSGVVDIGCCESPWGTRGFLLLVK